MNKDDVNAAKKFTEIGEAYEILGDEEKRKSYDMFGHSAPGAGPRAGASYNPFTQNQAEEIFKQFFRNFGGDFGGNSRFDFGVEFGDQSQPSQPQVRKLAKCM